MMRHGFPVAPPGLRVGLLGGSFDPAHEGHAHITREAFKRLKLDRIWWLVSPGNPLKARGPAPMQARLAAARQMMQHPRVEITDIEARIGTRYTARTLARLQAMYPGVRFVWLMGADNLAGFHRWDHWEDIMRRVPVAVFARPGARVRARRSKAALRFGAARIKAANAGILALTRPPAWVFLNTPMRDISSSRLRAGGGWHKGGDTG
jgi:nicotinate-nucleotide adenylyltransferase